jgi:hypothetical protein
MIIQFETDTNDYVQTKREFDDEEEDNYFLPGKCAFPPASTKILFYNVC